MKEILQTETPIEIKVERPSSPYETILKENRITDSCELIGATHVNIVDFVRIEDDGEGIFKSGSKERAGTHEIGSGYKRERAVYLVDVFLGFDLVPPTVIRKKDDEEGSLQKFIPDVRTGRELMFGEKEGNQEFIRQAGRMMLLDMIVDNRDRHGGNFLVDKKNDKLYAIDNGYAFSTNSTFVKSMLAINITADNFKYDDETVNKLKKLNEDENKKQILSILLLELIGKRETSLFFKRLELVSQNINENRISEDALKFLDSELSAFYKKYNKKITEFIENAGIQGLTQQEVVDQLLNEGQVWAIAEHIDKFDKLNKKVALQLIKNGFSFAIDDAPDRFVGLDKEIALLLIKKRVGFIVAKNLDRFEGLDHEEIALRLIEDDFGWAVARNFENFKGLDHEEMAMVLINYGNSLHLVENFDKFVGLDNKKIILKIIELGDSWIIARNLNRFEDNDLDEGIALKLIEADCGEYIPRYINKFKGLNHKKIALRLIETGKARAVAQDIDKFIGLDEEIFIKLKPFIKK